MKVLMPLRAFIDSDGPGCRGTAMVPHTVLMPLRAFIDSDHEQYIRVLVS